jgi:hypothetical protein
MDTVLGETSYLTKNSASGSITFETKGLRVLNVMVLEILPLDDIVIESRLRNKHLILLSIPVGSAYLYCFWVYLFFIFILKAVWLPAHSLDKYTYFFLFLLCNHKRNADQTSVRLVCLFFSAAARSYRYLTLQECSSCVVITYASPSVLPIANVP